MVAIVVHLYYIDMLEDLCGHLDKLRKHMDFDVFVTVPDTFDCDEIEMIRQHLNPKLIEPMENRGRDVLPFLNFLPKLEGYDYACKIHTKSLEDSDLTCKGPKHEDGVGYHTIGDNYYNRTPRDEKMAFFHWMIGAELGNEQCCKNIRWAYRHGIGVEKNDDPHFLEKLPKPQPIQPWRDLMWNSLLSPNRAREAIESLRDGAGIYAPPELWLMTYRYIFFSKNGENMNKISKEVGKKMKAGPFIAGTMFWFKPSALMYLAEHDWEGMFEVECGKNDGQMEHAFERCFHQLAEKN